MKEGDRNTQRKRPAWLRRGSISVRAHTQTHTDKNTPITALNTLSLDWEHRWESTEENKQGISLLKYHSSYATVVIITSVTVTVLIRCVSLMTAVERSESQQCSHTPQRCQEMLQPWSFLGCVSGLLSSNWELKKTQVWGISQRSNFSVFVLEWYLYPPKIRTPLILVYISDKYSLFPKINHRNRDDKSIQLKDSQL